jgi:hypothetical protein
MNELIFLSQEPVLIDILWKIAALPQKSLTALRDYLEQIDDPSRLTVAEAARGRLSLEVASSSHAASNGRHRRPASRRRGA